MLIIKTQEKVIYLAFNLVGAGNAASGISSISTASSTASINGNNNLLSSGYYGAYHSLTFEVKFKCKMLSFIYF